MLITKNNFPHTYKTTPLILSLNSARNIMAKTSLGVQEIGQWSPIMPNPEKCNGLNIVVPIFKYVSALNTDLSH